MNQQTTTNQENVREAIANMRRIEMAQMTVCLLYARRNGARLMGLLAQMTTTGLLNWSLVRGTGHFAKITAREDDGSFSVTITRSSSGYGSPIRIEMKFVENMGSGLTTTKEIDITLDPGNFCGLQAEVWRKAVEFFPKPASDRDQEYLE